MALKLTTMMLIVANAAALMPMKAPRRRDALTVRGGMSVATVGAALYGAQGITGFVAPELNLGLYKVPKPTDKDLLLSQWMSLWQITAAVVMFSSAPDAARISLFAGTVGTLISLPIAGGLKVAKAPYVGWTILMALLTKGIQIGKTPGWVPGALYISAGACFYALTDLLVKLLGPSKMTLFGPKTAEATPFGDMAIQLGGAAMLAAGTLLTSLAKGSSPSTAFGYAYVVIGLTALKAALVDAKKIGMPKAGGLAWSAVCAVISFLSLK